MVRANDAVGRSKLIVYVVQDEDEVMYQPSVRWRANVRHQSVLFWFGLGGE
jgi:hypothetical protein